MNIIKEIEDIAEEYYSTENQIKLLEDKKEKLREVLAKYTPDKGYASTFFKSSWATKRVYEYSDELVKKEKAYKEIISKEKEVQELEGAKFKETKILKVSLY